MIAGWEAILEPELEILFRTIVEQSPASTQVYTRDGETILVNRAWERLWGVTLDQLGGYNVLRDQQLVEKGVMPYIQRAFAGESVEIPPIKYEPEQTRPGISPVPYRWVAAWAYPIKDAQGQVSHVVFMGQDVTARVQAEERLGEKEAQYRGIFEATNDALIITDAHGVCVEANPAACRLYGYSYDEMIGLHAMAATHPAYYDLARTFLAAIEAQGSFVAESVAVRKDGTPFDIETRASRFMHKGEPHILAVVRDVTERVQARDLLERRVEERTRELATLLDVSHTVASTLDLEPLLDLILAQLQTIVEHTGASVNSLEGDSMVVLHRRGPGSTEHVRDGHRFPLHAQPLTWALLSRGEPAIIDDVYDDTPLAQEFRTVYGYLMPTALSYVRAWMGVPLMVQERIIGTLVAGADTPGMFGPRQAALMRAVANQAAVAIENARLYEQAQEVAALRERQRLARELHDSVSQALYGIALGARTARTLLDRDPDKVAEPLDYVLSLAQTGLAEMRALIFELLPHAMETEGLVAALRKQAATVQARQDMTIAVRLDGEPEVSLAVKQALYRIGQEALHNAVKHARARTIELRLEANNGELTLAVRDDGAGFETGGAFPGHLGLRTMRERAEQLGGSLEITSAPGAGTRVVARVPGAARV